MNGVFIINKPKGITSRDVVNLVSKRLGTKKVGHTGTLDPLATGVLVICVGCATKLVSELTCNDKEYIASVTLGIQTDTLDISGVKEKDVDVIKSADEIFSVLQSYRCKYMQEVPIYSAVKLNGKKLYEYAREGIDIELPKREVEIKDIELLDDVEYEGGKTKFKFRCIVSKGTYIRSLIRDIASSLGTYGVMTDLNRIRQGRFDIKNAITIDEVSEKTIIKIEDIFDITKISISDDIRKKVYNGAEIRNIYNCAEVLFLDKDVAVAIYKLDEVSNTLKPYKMLNGGKI